MKSRLCIEVHEINFEAEDEIVFVLMKFGKSLINLDPFLIFKYLYEICLNWK